MQEDHGCWCALNITYHSAVSSMPGCSCPWEVSMLLPHSCTLDIRKRASSPFHLDLLLNYTTTTFLMDKPQESQLNYFHQLPQASNEL